MKEKRKFSDWFENVFWYHYRWRAVAAVFVAAFAIFAVVRYVGSARPDFSLVLARTEAGASASGIRKTAVAAYKDYSGDRGAKVQFLEQAADAGDPAEKAEARLYAFLNDPDITLYILDGFYFDLYDSLGYFTDSAELGGGLYGAVRDCPVTLVTNETKYYEKFEPDELADVNAELEAEHQGYLAAARALLVSLKGAL